MSTFSGVQQGDGKQNPAIFTPDKFDAALKAAFAEVFRP